MAKPLTPQEYMAAKKEGTLNAVKKENSVSSQKGWNTGLGKEVQENIKARGTIQDSFKKFVEGGTWDKITSGLDIATAPFSLPISAAANYMTKVQEKGWGASPIELAKEIGLGITGQKRGGFQDVFRGAGMGKTSSMVAGLASELLVPAGAVGQGLKMLGRGSKVTDKGLKVAGKLLVQGSDDAMKVVGNQLENAFQAVNKTPVDGNKFIDAVVKMPDNLISVLEKEFGTKFDDVAQVLTVENLRKVKQTLGKIKAGMFGKEAKGAIETLDVDKVNDAYSAMKNLLKESIRAGHGNKIADNVMKAEEAYSSADKASRFLKKTLNDTTLLRPTKGGIAAEKLASRTDLSFRDAISTLRKSGKQAERKLNTAVDNLNNFNKWMARQKLIEGAGRAFAYGGIAGAVGSKLLNRKEGD